MRKTTAITLGVLVLAAAACSNESNEEISHCVDDDGVVVADDSVCDPGYNPVIVPGGIVHHYRWYYGGYRAPQAPGTRLFGGGFVRRPGAVYVTPRVYTTRRISVPQSDGVGHSGPSIDHG